MENLDGLRIPRTLDEACDPRRMALLVYDMQVGVVGQIQNGSVILERVTRVVEAARAGGFPIFYCRHMFLPTEVAGVSALRNAMAWQRVDRVVDVKPTLLRDSPEFALVPELAPAPSEVIFDKTTMSVFVGTPLEMVLRDRGIDTFAVVGIAMEIGIEPTVRHGMDLGLFPVVVADACGAGSQAAAQRSLDTLAFIGGSLRTEVATICPLLAAGRGR